MTSRTTRPVRAIRSTRAVRLCAAAACLALVAVAGACGDSDDAGDGEGTSSTSSSTSTTEGTTSSTDGTTSSTPGGLEGAATTPVSVPYAQIETAQLTDVTVGSHEGYDRVVFTFDGELPGYDIGYLDGQVTEDGSGEPVEIGGTNPISVRMTPASGARLDGEQFELTYDGPDRIAGPGNPVVEVVRSGDFEAQVTWAIGVEGKQPFKVSTLTGPTRIVVDVAAG